MKRALLTLLTLSFAFSFVHAQHVPTVEWDSRSLIIDGHRVLPIMGEIHYSRIPADEWQAEVGKIKAGGVTMIACYVFWNHIEEQEGRFDWSGQRDLRTFLEICKAADMPVVLRVGPFCHGEVRCGGIPDWVFDKPCRTRSEEPEFLKYVERLYRQIYTQVQRLQWKDGGPVIAMQFDNEYRGRASYLLSLKRIANNIGFDLPFYTRTGWPDLATPVPYGELLPLYGDYADGFWERSIEETAGDYYKAFNFRAFRTSTAIASEQLSYDQTTDETDAQAYPYFTCELGGGMMTSYHRRVYMYPEDAYAMAVVKLGSGSNLLGYYMYHGGTNPQSTISSGSSQFRPYDGDRHVYLNETQRSRATNYNDLPVLTYDFQAPLGEFGQRRPHYYLLRKLHLFTHDYAETLAPMDAHFPCEQNIAKGDNSHLRWSYRSQGDSAFVFVNNYERLQTLTPKRDIQFSLPFVTFPSRPITIPAGTSCIFPIGISGLRWATAQILCRRGADIYLEKIPGISTELAFTSGRTMRGVKALGTTRPVYTHPDGWRYFLLDSKAAATLFLSDEESEEFVSADKPIDILHWTKVADAETIRTISIGVNKAAEAPLDSVFDHAAIYTIDLPSPFGHGLIDIHYRGDCARLYAGDELLDDNFYNGRHFQYALWHLPADTRQLTLRILPLQDDMPVYFPREAQTADVGEQLFEVSILTP